MDKNNTDNTNKPDIGESSSYLGNIEADSQLDFSGLFSRQFSNILPLYSSNHGPAEIYTATRYGKRFVLKGLKEQFRDDPIYVLALAKEFEIGISLEHPNIRRTLSLETVDEIGKAIVLEYVDGCSLEALLSDSELTVHQARHIVEQTADAMAYLHSKQIFHRDLKPSNILISHHGNVVKIIDFNLSDSDEFIVLKNPAGSRKYMAPEQLNPDAKPSAAADIYSLGIIMGELAAATGDQSLANVAAKCANQKPVKRPQALSQIKLPSSQPSAMQTVSNFLSSKTLTYIMLSICFLLSAVIVYMLIKST